MHSSKSDVAFISMDIVEAEFGEYKEAYGSQHESGHEECQQLKGDGDSSYDTAQSGGRQRNNTGGSSYGDDRMVCPPYSIESHRDGCTIWPSLKTSNL